MQLDEELIEASKCLLECRRLMFVVNVDLVTDSFNISLRPVSDLLSMLNEDAAIALKVYDASRVVPVVMSCRRPHSMVVWLNPVSRGEK